MGEHYFSKTQSSSYEPFLITIRPKGQDPFELYSASGVFSLKHLDKGSEVLIRYSQISPDSFVLDLGCGYGVVGISVYKKVSPLNIVFVDSSERAVKLTKKNLTLHKIKAKVKQSNIFSNIDDLSFDVILTNPPYSAGRDVCKQFVTESFAHLNKEGSLQLVCRRQKGGDFFESFMKDIFGNVEVIGQKSGFRVYKSIKY